MRFDVKVTTRYSSKASIHLLLRSFVNDIPEAFIHDISINEPLVNKVVTLVKRSLSYDAIFPVLDGINGFVIKKNKKFLL